MDLVSYFQSHENYFWEWITDKDVRDSSGYLENNLILVPNVGVIAYRPYIIEVLKELQTQGLPPFGAFLLTMYATQDGYLNLDGIFYFLRKYRTEETSDFNLDIKNACQLLENLSKIGNSMKRGQNRINLFQTIFKDSVNLISAEESEYILNSYHRSPQKIGDAAEKLMLSDDIIDRDIETLSFIHNRFPTTESIVKAIQGLTVEPEIKEELAEERTAESEKDFIQELIEEPKTFQLGSLIKRIWSGLKIPMRHLSPGEQPIGGVADITNKGDLHRMLLSEYANEDEVFMNRVANNEALYIQREIPPEENIFERIILIDTSLKNWGTPKVLSFASALAVIKHPKAHSECKVYALGQSSIAMTLDRVEEVIENLNLVSGTLDVSEALDLFFKKERTEKDLEVFFITHHENLANESLQKVIHENRNRLKFLVTTSSDGELNFYKHHLGARKHIQKIVLPLKELWADPPYKKSKRSASQNGKGEKTDVPLNYPLLFPIPQQQIAKFMYEGEFFILSSKKQLLRTYLSDNYYNRNYYDLYKILRGCEVLFENISIKDRGMFALAKNKQQQFILCQYQQDKKLISKLNIETKEYSELNISGFDIPLHVELVYFNKHFYLHESSLTNIFEINLEGEVSIESIKNDPEIHKNIEKVKIEVDKLNRNNYKFTSNFTLIGINENNNLVISKYELKFWGSSMAQYKNQSPIVMVASQDKNKFTFSDGSEIIADSRGMITFRSINANIPEFYMPTSTHTGVALASEKEFGGYEYYLPDHTLLKVKTVEDMYQDYLQPFIDQVLEYGAKD
ncbi:hypothetical protein SAMN05443633_105180 [Chryseobacterium arachidis]|uniref:Uncharacterized protein n=1 Tax=Chryseobacterium arachidis TaxID=1416778 RepID=A0A1M5D7E0_9FLAO|nr:hypothetical protein [Chryseobacterium arachidis]SHF62969.1 hypothetical protein SAMN05443633_105180 [Chryseobacterium arachidis]